MKLFRLIKTRSALVTFASAISLPALADHALVLRSGLARFDRSSLTSATNVVEQNLSNATLEWLNYFTKDMASGVGYRILTDGGNVTFQEAFVNFRYYPLTLGVGINQVIQYNRIEYDFFLKPYVFAGAAFGRTTLEKIGNISGAEVGTPFLSYLAGIGTQITITRKIAFDINATYEMATGVGSDIAYSAKNIFLHGGIQYYF